MTKYIVAARIDENGRITGGAAGDQTGKEVMCQTLASSGTWATILRPPKGAETIVKQAYAAAANDNIGYDQSGRTTLYNAAKAANWNLAAIKTRVECDCSALVAVLCNCAGFSVSKDMWTGNEVATLTAKGFKKYAYNANSLRPGDVLLRNGHTGVYVGTSATYKGGTAKKSNSAIADEVIEGIWGNGAARKAALEKAGYNYSEIQKIVDERLSGASKKVLKVGSRIKVKSGAHIYGTTKLFAPFVYKTVYKVVEIRGARVVFATTDKGAVIGAVSKNDCVVQ